MPDVMTLSNGIDYPPIMRVMVRGINGKIAGPISIGTIPAGNKILIPFWIGAALTQAVGVTSAATISLGTNSPNFNDMVAALALTGVAQGQYGPLTLKPVMPLLTAGVGVSLNISTAAVASGAYTLALMVLGVWA